MAPDNRYRVACLGERTLPSPLALSTTKGDAVPDYVLDGTLVLGNIELLPGARTDAPQAFEKAGPHDRIFFDPVKARAAILTSGGLCPGINNVIRSIVLELVHKYGVECVEGIRYGFAGLNPASGTPEPVPLGPAEVSEIHAFGGTVLGTSRGPQTPDTMLDVLLARGIDMLFVIGGDGTMRGAHAIAEEAKRRGARLSVVGVPKTIDNDIPYVDKTFGFETAVAMARMAIDAAHTEARSARNGVGLVKLMGRAAGFIAATASVASHDVNACLIPEVPFKLEGEGGLFEWLERRLGERQHAVIVVAEGCGASLAQDAASQSSRDASGNVRFGTEALDIGRYLERSILAHFQSRGLPLTLKYIDPSYMLRSVPAGAIDAVFCASLARHAVHAAMAGKTDMMVGVRHGVFVHVPLPLVLAEKKRVDPDGELWLAVTESTGQPRFV